MVRGKRVRIGLGAGAGVVAVAAVVAGVRGCAGPDTLDDVHGPVAAARAADHRPHGPYVRNAPYDCGMARAVLEPLVGAAEKTEQQSTGSDSCTWENGAGSGRTLEVDLELATGDDGRPDPAAAIADLTRMITGATRTADAEFGPVTALTGLGADAAAWTEAEETRGKVATTVVFQAGNVAARITYGGVDRARDGVDFAANPLDAASLNGARTAAVRLARQIGAPVTGTPRPAPPPSGPRVRTVPAACDLVPADAVRAAVDNRELRAKREESYLFGGEGTGGAAGLTADRCAWSGGLGRSVDVDWLLVGGAYPLGTGPAVTRREYERQYLDARDTPGGTAAESVFTALGHPGGQAFAHYEKDDILDGGAGIVLVQARNTLIRVRCWDIDAYAPDDAMNCAYTIARAAAKRVGA
ncbi:MAG TPA: hypothetical protein VGL93_21855 [Streptosporangiaceae bacterium]|jgi:hypothetical protein